MNNLSLIRLNADHSQQKIQDEAEDFKPMY